MAKAAQLERKKMPETCPPVRKGKKGHGGACVNSGRKKALYNKVNTEFYTTEFSVTRFCDKCLRLGTGRYPLEQQVGK